MPTIEQLEKNLREAGEGKNRAWKEKRVALERYNGTASVLVNGKLHHGLAGDKSPETKRAYETAKAAYARAARTYGLAVKAYQDAGGGLDPSGRPVKRAAAAQPKRSSKPKPVYDAASSDRFFLDLVKRAEAGPSSDAAKRIERHLRATGQVERRESGTTQAQGFAAPNFYAENWADVPRTAAPVFAACPKLPLPAFGLDAYVPAWTTGSQADVQTKTSGVNDDVAQGDATPVQSEQVTASLVTVAEDWQVDRQPLERARPGWDISFGRDFAAAVFEKLDDQLINGVGSSSQEHLGLLNVVGALTFDATSATTAQKQLRALSEAAALQFATRKRLPEYAVMSPARALSLFSGMSDADAPLMMQGALGFGGNPEGSFGSLLPGVRVLLTDKIADSKVILWRASDALIAVDDQPLLFDYLQRGSNALSVHLVGFLFSQFFGHRIPSSVQIVENLPSIAW